jgi:hypothetical protein
MIHRLSRSRRFHVPILAHALCAALSFAAAGSSEARPDQYRDNLREACRRTVAGAYLRAYDERQRTVEYVKALKGNLDETETALAAARKRLATAKAAAAAKAFDTELAVRVDQAAAEAGVLEKQRDDYKRLHDEAKSKVATLERAEGDLRKRIETVFLFTRTDDRPDGGYPIRLDYKAPCPKYRSLCPLPRELAARLEALEVNGATPVECTRYASFSHIR